MTSFQQLKTFLQDNKVKLVAISKTHSPEAIQKLYDAGQRAFGENKVQELLEKKEKLPKDIQWHLVGHLQRNKVKHVAPFVHLIHSVDSFRLLKELDKRSLENERVLDILIQIHIAEEDSKYGVPLRKALPFFDEIVRHNFEYLNVRGLMGMATFTDDEHTVRKEFAALKKLFDELKSLYSMVFPDFNLLSMGMSGDYELAIDEGSNMVRIGSLIFGQRS